MNKTVGGLALLFSSVCLGADAHAAPPAQPHNEVMLGVYQIAWSPKQHGAAYEKVAARLRRQAALVMFYRDLGCSFPSAFVRRLERLGVTPVITWELWFWGERSDSPSRLPAIVEGEFDDYFRTWAEELKKWGKPIFIRFGPEMNGSWFSWGGRDPEMYKRAWRHVRAIFRAVGANNGIWVWCPNVKSIPEVERAPWNAAHEYYPGDDVVDWVGVDGYNWGRSRESNGFRWVGFDSLFGATLREFDERYPDKWQMIGEFASTDGDGGSKAKWIRDAYAAIPRYPRLAAVVWFNYDKRGEGEVDWRITSSSDALEAYNEATDRRWFASSFAEWAARHSTLKALVGNRRTSLPERDAGTRQKPDVAPFPPVQK